MATGRYASTIFGIALAGILSASSVAASTLDEKERDVSGVRLQIDNDLFVGGDRDRDYTGGFAVTFSGADARDRYLSLDPALASIDRFTSGSDAVAPESSVGQGSARAADTYHARQFGLMVFTPKDVLSSTPVQNDRPYASLLFTSNARTRVAADDRTAWSSSLTVGVLGLALTESIHGAVHSLVGSENPRGYAHQISAGGEPTARYTLARHVLLVADPNSNVDVKATVQGSIGFLTEASAAVTVRFGRVNTPWWGFAPELTDYIAAPTPIVREQRPEMYAFAGIRVKARAYNAFLQGQFRDSTVRHSYDETEPLVAEGWVGFVTRIFEQTQVSYTLNYQTAELRHGPANRGALWGAVQVSHSF